MAGFSAERQRYDNLCGIRYGLVDESLPEVNLTYGQNANDYGVTGGSGHSATAGFFGRINYDYKGRYLVEFNGRYDGSTKLPRIRPVGILPLCLRRLAFLRGRTFFKSPHRLVEQR